MKRTNLTNVLVFLMAINLCANAASGGEKLIAGFNSESDISLWAGRQTTAQLTDKPPTEQAQHVDTA